MKPKNGNKTAYAYARISTQGKTRSMSIEDQKKVIEDFCKKNNLKLLDTASDSCHVKCPHRPGLFKLFKLLEKKSVDYVLVTDLDRLVRSISDYKYLSEQFNRYGASIHPVQNTFSSEKAHKTFIQEVIDMINLFGGKDEEK